MSSRVWLLVLGNEKNTTDHIQALEALWPKPSTWPCHSWSVILLQPWSETKTFGGQHKWWTHACISSLCNFFQNGFSFSLRWNLDLVKCANIKCTLLGFTVEHALEPITQIKAQHSGPQWVPTCPPHMTTLLTFITIGGFCLLKLYVNVIILCAHVLFNIMSQSSVLHAAAVHFFCVVVVHWVTTTM